jgi:hypothetical protein
MAVFGTQTNTPEYFVRGALAPVVELTGGAVPAGTAATLLLAGTLLTINGTIQVVGANRKFVPNNGMRVPLDATIGNATTAVLSAAGHTNLNITADVSPATLTADCPTINATYNAPAIVPNTVIDYQDGRRERVLLTDIAGASTQDNLSVGTLAVTGSASIGNAPTDTLGFYGATAIARPSAYTQTYTTTSKTVADLTSATLTDSTTGTANTTVQDVTAAFSQTILNNNFADLVAQVNALRADLVATKNNLNSALDDLQALGLLA